jgi:hypothetical protein
MKIFVIFILLFCLTFGLVLWSNMTQYETFTFYFQFLDQFRHNLSKEDFLILIVFFLPLVIQWGVNAYQKQKKEKQHNV